MNHHQVIVPNLLIDFCSFLSPAVARALRISEASKELIYRPNLRRIQISKRKVSCSRRFNQLVKSSRVRRTVFLKLIFSYPVLA